MCKERRDAGREERWRELDRAKEREKGREGEREKHVCGHSCPRSDGKRE